MHELESIEKALGRLMPSALSEEASHSIGTMLDELSCTTPATPVTSSAVFFIGPIAAAAALVLAVGSAWFMQRKDEPVALASGLTPTGLVLVGESDLIESIEDEGYFTGPDGEEIHAVRIFVVEENSLRDEETGIVVKIREPREEMMLMPVSTF